MNHDRWAALMHRLNLPLSPETCDMLLAAHEEPGRHYHTVAHISHLLGLLDEHRENVPKPDLVELAFWFHDAVYDTRSKTNEVDSAEMAEAFLSASKAPEIICERVTGLILATRHNASDLKGAAAWMGDIDLSILGAEPARFDLYDQQIRQEYAWVPQESFQNGRRELLAGFLARDWIYHTDAFRHSHEEKARGNIRRSMNRLT